MTGVSAARVTAGPQQHHSNTATPRRGATAGAGTPNAGARRARWVDATVRDARRQAGACIRCGAKGHFIADCGLRPARPPTANTTNVQALQVDEGTTDEEGKE